MLEVVRAYWEGRTPLLLAKDALDIFLVYYLAYRALLVLRGTRAMQVGVGLSLVFVLYLVAQFLTGLSSSLLGLSAALAEYHYEHDAPGASIRTFGDALWWAAATLATVGYGDVVPVTVIGRLIAVVLMGCGLALLGAVTGSFSSYLMQRFARAGDDMGPRGR